MRASEFGGCVRALVAKELGYAPLDPPPRMQKVFDAGNDAETRVLELLTAKGWEITRGQGEVEFLGITGHIDGFTEHGVLEIKSMNPENYARFLDTRFGMGGLMERYKWQVSVYMHALRNGAATAPLVFVAYNRTSEDLCVERRDLPFHTEAAIRARVDLINRYVEIGELPPCDQNTYPCPFVYLHVPEEKDRDALVEELGEQYRALGIEEGQLKEKQTKVRASLLEAMGDRESVDCPNVRVTRYQQQNPPVVDRAAMKTDGVWERYSKPGSISERLRVTLRDQEQEAGNGLGTSKD